MISFIKKHSVIILAFLIVIAGALIYQNRHLFLADNEVAIQRINETTDFYEITVEYPSADMIGSAEVTDFIRSHVREFKGLAERVENDLGVTHAYTLDIDIQNYRSSEYFSYVIYIAEYTGGANVNQLVESFVYDIETQESVSLETVLSDDREDQFVQDVQNELWAKSDERGIFPGYVNKLTLDLLDTFYVTDRDISVLFSKYEVAPGAAGIIEVTIPTDK